MRSRTTLSLALLGFLATFSSAGGAGAQPASSDPAVAAGLAALKKSDYAEAEKQLGASSDLDAKLALGRAALEQGKLADAEKAGAAAMAGSAAQKAAGATLKAETLAKQGKRQEAIALLQPYKNAKGDEGRRTRLVLGELLVSVGKRADAEALLKAIVDDYNNSVITETDAVGLAYAGRAAQLLRYPKDANKLFNKAENADKDQVEGRIWHAELFVDKFDPGHAEEVTKEALGLAPHRADALVLLARIKLDQAFDFDAADKLVKEALEVDPKNTGAYAVRASVALHDMNIADADKAVADGLAIDPGNTELLALKAAGRFLDDDRPGYEATKKETLAKNPEFSRFFAIVGELAEWEHRYDDIVAMMKEATKIDPDDGKAWAELGLTEMRGGDETAGLDAIRKAWDKDGFNVRVYNTLNLYEQAIPQQYETVTDGVMKVRYAKDERPVMERYVPRMLAEAWGSMKSRYGFVPSTPVQVEMYASREQFSVRTSGLPNIGIQGVCFGRVVAAISPKAEPFNWGNVLWHELGHVFAIQLSKNHVPRWFTEGLSEYETIARRPEWARELDPQLYEAITQNKLPSAVDMNRAFTHASDAEDVTVAYYAASQMLIFTVERYGMGGVRKALELWGQGKKTPAVIQSAFGVSPSDYDAAYRSWQLGRLSRYKNQYLFTLKPKELDEADKDIKARPNEAAPHVVKALALMHGRKAKEAKQEIEAALKIDPKSGDAHFVAAKLAIAVDKDVAAAEKHLEEMRAAGSDGFVVQSLLADIAEEKKDKEGMRFHLEAAYRWDPSQSEPLKGLFDLAHEGGDEAAELDLLQKLAQLEQHDHKVWRLYLEKLVAKKSWEEARKVGESAVFVDVLGGQTHTLYARALSAQGAHDKAAYELESAVLCKLKDKEMATAHALLAGEYVTLKRPADAKKHLDQALKLDPDNADAKNVKLP